MTSQNLLGPWPSPRVRTICNRPRYARRNTRYLKTMNFEIEKTDEQWLAELGPERFHVLRQAGTEAPFTGDLLHVNAVGDYSCAACNQVLFTNEDKFDAHCGWPSFDKCEPGTIVERSDTSLSRERTEILCARCGGHLGHVFNDGPTATGLRYCVNSLSIAFQESDD